MFDPECYKLAYYFLHGEPFGLSARKDELAQAIQDAVDDWLAMAEHEAATYKPPKDEE